MLLLFRSKSIRTVYIALSIFMVMGFYGSAFAWALSPVADEIVNQNNQDIDGTGFNAASKFEQIYMFVLLGVTLGLFVWGRWRYDLIALTALMAVSVPGLVEPGNVFSGFGHPAVITVAAVLIISRGLQNAGVVNFLARVLSKVGSNPTLQVTTLVLTVAVCSAFMNNVGALALLMPVAIWMARRSGRSPSYLLMPLAFGSLLGGMTTLIGTPPNLIVSSFRAAGGNQLGFGFFDFAFVGVGVMLAGVAFIGAVGWRLIPDRQAPASAEDLMKIDDYLSEVVVGEKSVAANETLYHFESEIAKDLDITVIGLIRGERRRLAPRGYTVIRAGDRLLIEGNTQQLAELLESAGLQLYESREDELRELTSDEIRVMEAIVAADSSMIGKTPGELQLRTRYGMNVLAVARQGGRLTEQLSRIRLASGDILLAQGPSESLNETLSILGCLPLAERALSFPRPKKITFSISLFAAGIACTTLGWVNAPTAFTIVALIMILIGIVSLREAYRAIDWPIIVLLGAMIPIGSALETTGGAATIAGWLQSLSVFFPAWITLAILLVGTMCLSDIINNAAAAVLMCPIAVNVARAMDCSTDPFLIAVGIGASCAFMTPIGHQSSTLVMVPGGYRFGDYWRLGLPLQIIILVVSIPLILWIWPLK